MDVMEKDVDSRERVTVRIGSWFTTSSRVGDALLVAWLLRFGKLYSIVLSHVPAKSETHHCGDMLFLKRRRSRQQLCEHTISRKSHSWL